MAELDVSDLLTVDQAIRVIDAAAVRPRVVTLPLERAQGLVLAEPIRADRDYPPFDKSLMDGYAVRAEDVRDAPVKLNVIGEVAAGRSFDRPVQSGEAVAIMTGAPMPPGADGVVPVEETAAGKDEGGRMEDEPEASRVHASSFHPHPSPVRILRGTSPDRAVARRGADVAAGRVVLEVGSELTPAALAVAASVGASHVRVYARPRVGVLATGDELVPIDHTPGPAQIRNSNNLMFVALLSRLGCDVTDLGVALDDRDVIRDALTKALAFDVVFVSGGMSMGRYDHVPAVLNELGADLRVTKLRIKPGKPFVFAVIPPPVAASRTNADAAEVVDRYVFGLPGNPVSGFVCTVRLAARLIARLRGTTPRDRWIEGRLTEPLAANGPREFYQPALVRPDGRIEPLAWKGSADIYTLARATALLVRRENEPAVAVGATVRVLGLPT